MIVAESHRTRRIVGRLDRGVELIETIADLCRKHKVRCGEIRAIGSLEAIEVSEYDQREKQWRSARRFQCAFEILNLTGNISERAGEMVVHAHISVMRERDNGIEVLGGHLVRARVFALEFVIDAFDDVLLRRGTDEATGLQLWNEKFEAPRAEPTAAEQAAAPVTSPSSMPFNVSVPNASTLPSQQSTSWAEVARASEAAARAEDESGEEYVDATMMKTGDVLEHPRFGRCRVERIEGEHEFASVRLETGRLVRLALDVLRFKLGKEESGTQVFQVRVQK